MAAGTPVLIYDGDCGFCRCWLAWARKALGDRLEYIPLQDPQIPPRFPGLSRDRLEESVHLVEPDGTVSRGARAVFEALDRGWSSLPIRAYRRIPGVAAVSEWGYRIIAGHRQFFSVFTVVFCGRSGRS